jgi:hypothetical protein
MIEEVEDRIRERAHALWEGEGRPAGRAEAHWFQAAAEIVARKTRAATRPKAARAAAAAPAASRTAKTRAATATLETVT